MLNRAQVKLRQDISRANKRIARFAAAGVSSPAAERLLTAVGAEDGKLHAPKTLSQEIAMRQALDRFFKSATSTLKGYRAVQKKRREKTYEAFRDMGFEGTEIDIDDALQGAKSFKSIAEQYSISSDDVRVEYVRGASHGERNAQIMARLDELYGKNEIDDLNENNIDEINK